MNLKEAKQNNKLSQLIKEREKKTPANRKSCFTNSPLFNPISMGRFQETS